MSCKKLQKKSKLSSAGRATKNKKNYNRCDKATRAKLTITSFELLYDTPQSDEDILRSIREAYLGAS